MLIEMKVEVLSFDEMKELYYTNPYFSEMWREWKTPTLTKKLSKFDEYFIQ